MTKYDLIISCKDKKTLKEFFKFLSVRYHTELKRLMIPLSFSQKKTKVKKITVLKSPHVNKTAQKHFEYRIYSIKINFYSYKPQKYLLLLKKIQNHIFPEIRIKIKQNVYKQKSQILIKNNFLNPNNFRTNFIKCSYNSQQNLNDKKIKNNKTRVFNVNLDSLFLKKIVDYIRVFDQYGSLN